MKKTIVLLALSFGLWACGVENKTETAQDTPQEEELKEETVQAAEEQRTETPLEKKELTKDIETIDSLTLEINKSAQELEESLEEL